MVATHLRMAIRHQRARGRRPRAVRAKVGIFQVLDIEDVEPSKGVAPTVVLELFFERDVIDILRLHGEEDRSVVDTLDANGVDEVRVGVRPYEEDNPLMVPVLERVVFDGDGDESFVVEEEAVGRLVVAD